MRYMAMPFADAAAPVIRPAMLLSSSLGQVPGGEVAEHVTLSISFSIGSKPMAVCLINSTGAASGKCVQAIGNVPTFPARSATWYVSVQVPARVSSMDRAPGGVDGVGTSTSVAKAAQFGPAGSALK